MKAFLNLVAYYTSRLIVKLVIDTTTKIRDRLSRKTIENNKGADPN
jgi:hypothetical protein